MKSKITAAASSCGLRVGGLEQIQTFTPAGQYLFILFAMSFVILILFFTCAFSQDIKVAVDSLGASSVEAGIIACVASPDEATAVSCLRAISHSGSQSLPNVEDARLTLERVLSRGWFDAAEAVIDLSHAASLDVSTALHQTSGRIRARLSELAERLASTATATAIPPAIEWAQSPTEVFINVKWALKLSNPATLGCTPSPPEFGLKRVDFRAACDVKRKTFALAAALWGNITPANCTWAESSVGRASLTLRKAEDGPWPRLLLDKNERTPVWWAMHENMEAQNDAWRSKTPTPAPTIEVPQNGTVELPAAASSSPAAEAGAEEKISN